jgi:hypothetical protein
MNQKDHKPDPDSNHTERTRRLVEKLCAHPLLREQIEAILELVQGDDGPIRKADEVEEILVQEIRKLGKNAMQEWALGAEERSAAQLQHDSPGARCLKKKS